jgi:hypothetical protein
MELLKDVAAFANDAMRDPEFSREMRFFDGKLGISVGSDDTVLEFSDGRLVNAGKKKIDEKETTIFIRGSAEDWSQLLQPYPRPFFQCLQTAVVKHGMRISTTNQTYAYLPALNRFVSLLREKTNSRK